MEIAVIHLSWLSKKKETEYLQRLSITKKVVKFNELNWGA